MSFLKHNSWGRTRCPKNVAGPPGTAVTLESAPTDSATAGYATENQRYLHLHVDSDGATDSLVVYAYNHASAQWGKLMVPVGIKNGADTTFDLAYVSVEIEGNTTAQYLVVDIAGADRVAFVRDGTTDTITVYAACSSF